jgi:hypothetical protein
LGAPRAAFPPLEKGGVRGGFLAGRKTPPRRIPPPLKRGGLGGGPWRAARTSVFAAQNSLKRQDAKTPRGFLPPRPSRGGPLRPGAALRGGGSLAFVITTEITGGTEGVYKPLRALRAFAFLKRQGAKSFYNTSAPLRLCG